MASFELLFIKIIITFIKKFNYDIYYSQSTI